MDDPLLNKLSNIFYRVSRSFIFVDDVALEKWRMPPPHYDGRQLIRDDCDGFCLACRMLLRRQGIPNRLVYCEILERNRRYGHLVVEVEGWILDNRQQKVVANTKLRDYTWRYISGFEPADPWKEIVLPG